MKQLTISKDSTAEFDQLCHRAGIVPTQRQWNAYNRQAGAAYQFEMMERASALREYAEELARIEQARKRTSLR